MNHIRLFVALVAACILVMPALSMPNKEMGQDGNQKQCDGDNSLKYFEHKWQGQDSKENPSDCQKSMMGEDGQKMMQGQDKKENPSDCQKPMMGEDDQKMMQGQDKKENPSDCQKPMMGEDGQKHIKSMMGDKKKESNGEVKIVIINVNA